MTENRKLSLYYYDSCPYCRIVLQELSHLALQCEKRNIMQSREHYQDLINGGGKGTVPCLLIEEGESKQWMYESRDIVRYLNTL